MLRYYKSILGVLLLLLLGIGAMAWHLASILPKVEELAYYKAPLTTRIITNNGEIWAEVGTEKRSYVPIDEIPIGLQEAFISAEDKNFRIHSGFDLYGIFRAMRNNVIALILSNKLEGASTITQQVAKNFLLTHERTLNRKVKEAILTARIEKLYSKEYILELYLNKIYLGRGAYGVAAAAKAYFNKSMEKLSIGEWAFLAAIPKAPARFEPTNNYERAKERRDWVIIRLRDDEKITAKEAEEAIIQPLIVVDKPKIDNTGGYVGEEIRQEVNRKVAMESYNESGLSIKSTINSSIQREAEHALMQGLERYNREIGWRGVLIRIFWDKTEDEQNKINMNTGGIEPSILKEGKETYWHKQLERHRSSDSIERWGLAIVLAVTTDGATIGLRDGHIKSISLKDVAWAAPINKETGRKKAGETLKSLKQILQKGDIIYVEKKVEKKNAFYVLQQIPEVNGAIMVMETRTGRILAMQGGYDFSLSKFNRARQALRQPGSTFKTFVYMAALEKGYTPASIFLDAPIVGEEKENGLDRWKPKNYGSTYRGYTTLRTGIERSINLLSLRIAQEIGIEPIESIAQIFGIYNSMDKDYAMVLGSKETTLERMTTAFAIIANGGKKIEPFLIDTVQDRHGKTLYKNDNRDCLKCQNTTWEGQEVPQIEDTRQQVLSPELMYQMTSLLEGVVMRGTGTAARIQGYSIAAKTGTTNESRDVWFVGFSPDIVVGVYIGYDIPKSLGERATGGGMAAPIGAQVLKTALRVTKSRASFHQPENIISVWVNKVDGSIVEEGVSDGIEEVFIKGYEPKKYNPQTKAKGLEEKTAIEAMMEEEDGIY